MKRWQQLARSVEPKAAKLDGLIQLVFYTDEDDVPRVSYAYDGEVRIGRIIGDLHHIAHDFMHQAGSEDIK